MVQFSPWTQKNSSSAREFLARIICQQSTNPDCKIERKILLKGDPKVEIEYDNKEVTKLETSGMTVDDIVNIVKNRADEMEMSAQLKAAGLSGYTFTSTWKRDTKGKDFVGSAHKIPRQ
ncbi:hypothetical protein M9435_003879 [Picochlorum sp. BPE23]|nr:hypothetical protein M9435_003879 [Picochlorum sp. BPE23]